MSTALQPLSQSKRDASLDLLRGFALAGVLLTFCITDVGAGSHYQQTVLDEVVQWPKWLLVEGRMYTMLIMIFGIGFYVQLQKAKQKNVSLVPAFLRRLIGLLLIGFLHAILLSTRDVLMFYAVAGIFLLPMRNLSNRWLIVIMAVVFFIVTPIVSRFSDGYQVFSLPKPNNYADHLRHNWEHFKLYHQIYPIYCEMLLYFMIGFIVSRAGIFRRIQTDKIFRRRLLIIFFIGTVILIPLYFFWVLNAIGPFAESLSSWWQKFLVGTGFRLLYEIVMFVSAGFYIISLQSLWTTVKGKKWLSPFAAFGQMTLSNYVIQSIILVPYLLSFDKFDNLPPFYGFILFLVVLAVQLVFSVWWIARYTMGPFEWLLRSLTYWKWQKIKKAIPVENDLNTFYLSKTVNHL